MPSGAPLVGIPELHPTERRADSLEIVTTSATIPVKRKMPLNAPAYYRSDSNLSNPSPDPSIDGTSSPFAFEARTLPNVLRRISNLIAMGSSVSWFLEIKKCMVE